MFNSIQQKEYRENKGKICPYCKKESVITLEIKGELTIINQDKSFQNMTCTECKKSWKENYPIFDIEEMPQEEKEEK